MALPERKLERALAVVAGGLLPLTLLVHGSLDLFVASLTLLFLLFALIFLFRVRDMTRVAGEFALLCAGFLYVPFLLGHFILLRQSPHGISWIFLLLVIVMCGDTFAFYVGTSFGKHRLYPAVSPKKSIEGSLGGLAGSMVGALIVKATFFPELSLPACLITALLLGLLGQLGDLFESLLKRSFGVKDSGVIVPGHGGMLDRLDSLLFAVPAAFYCAKIIFGGQ
jgi:phosphatidate cytidylyltransferase